MKRNLTFTLKSLGCKVSQYDGERLVEKLKSLGLNQTEDKPDIFILNGCSVTGRASQKVRQTLRAASRKWPGVKLVLAGCEARLRQQRSLESSEADWVLPVYDDLETVLTMVQSLFPDYTFDAHGPEDIQMTAKTRAFLKVQDGCRQFCAYCIVPYLRGKEWSLPMAEARVEAEKLVAEGHKEIVLTGIHLGHFEPSLVELLKILEKVEGLERIRLSSIESVEVGDELIDWVATSPKACHHFHLPLQSGCDDILKAMKRPYLTADFRAVVDKIRHRMPLAAITTDLIVGFPGESEEHFAQTLAFLEEIEFSRIHIFKFSPRDGTPAATMPDQLSNAVKADRSNRVEEIWKKCAGNFYQKFVNRPVEILWETFDGEQLHGFSREYIPCCKKAAEDSQINHIETTTAKAATSTGLRV